MEKTIDDYISFYQAIPDDKWCTGVFTTDDGRCCALGHLGERNMNTTPIDVKNLQDMAIKYGDYISDVNDGSPEYLHLGDTPKERVVNYLKNLKEWRLIAK